MLFVKTQPVDVLQVSVVQTLLSSQIVAEPGWHDPPPQTSPVVQAFPSEQARVLFVKTQPVDVLQVSVVHGLLSLQVTGEPTHAPETQASVVQRFPSEQAFASLFVNTHRPSAGLQVSSVQGF